MAGWLAGLSSAPMAQVGEEAGGGGREVTAWSQPAETCHLLREKGRQ